MLADMSSYSPNGDGRRFSQRPDNGTVQPTAEYLRANGMLVERQSLSDSYGPDATSYYTEDILGSTLQLTDRRGGTTQTYAYTAFGAAYQGSLSDRAAAANPFGYTGKRYDQPAGLYDYGFRDYAPQIGRWTSEDPIRAGLNWYAYANEDPSNYIDQSGLLSTRVWGAVAIIGGAAIAVVGATTVVVGIETDQPEVSGGGYALGNLGVATAVGGIATVITGSKNTLPSAREVSAQAAAIVGILQSHPNLPSSGGKTK